MTASIPCAVPANRSKETITNDTKVSFNVDKNKLKHHHHDEDMDPSEEILSQQPSSSSSAAADAINSKVELLVNAAELREAAVRESSVANGTSSDSGEVAASHGGPFYANELEQLSLLCNSTPASSEESNIVNIGIWSSLTDDLLSTLIPMLRSHVVSALGIDLVGEGRDVIMKSMDDFSENKRENGKKQTITIHQVSAKYYYLLS